VRIGLLLYGGLDAVTGGTIYDRYLVNFLESQGIQVEIISLPWRRYPAWLADNFSRELAEKLLSLDVDLLIQDELCHPSLFLLNQRIRPRLRYPIISLTHHLRSSEAHPLWIRWLYRAIERRYLHSVDGFIFNSHTTQATVEAFLPTLPPHVVAKPGGDRLGDALKEMEIRQRASRPGPLRVAFLGSITRRKQPHLILEACTKLPPGLLKVLLIGSQDAEPGYAHRVRKMISGLAGAMDVTLEGSLNLNPLIDALRTQDILVVPSTYEGFGIVYREGMAMGLPAIGTHRGAAHETIRHGENGFLIEPNDSDALAEHLNTLSIDRSKLLKMSLAARESYQSGPTWEGMGQAVHTFLNENFAS
jgi:glycosyltransferase involved in cell wall biosynthesis